MRRRDGEGVGSKGVTAMSFDLDVVSSVLEGMPYPAHRWQIMTWAEFNGAALSVVDALMAIPEASYSCVRDVYEAAEATDAKASARLCQHRRHTRWCPMHKGGTPAEPAATVRASARPAA